MLSRSVAWPGSACPGRLTHGSLALQCNETLRNRWHDKHYDDDGNFDPILERYREKGPQKAGWNDHAFHATMEMTRVLWSLGIPAVQSGGNVLGTLPLDGEWEGGEILLCPQSIADRRDPETLRAWLASRCILL